MKTKKSRTSIVSLLLLVFFMFPALSFAEKNSKIALLLDSLDRVLANRQTILNNKRTVINDLKRGISEATTAEALTVKYEQIYQEYLHYNGDSAIAYAKKAVEAAGKTHRAEMVLTANFCILRALTRQGNSGKAYEVILDIGKITDLQPVYRAQYADLILDFYMRVNFRQDVDYIPDKELTEVWNEYSGYLVNRSPEYFFYQCFCTKQRNAKALENMLANLRKPSFQAANIYYALAMANKRNGNTEKFYENLIYAAVNDVELANTEMSSLLSLLQSPLLANDLKRSSEYVKVCSENVRYYHDMQRSIMVINVQERINRQLSDLRDSQMTVIVVVAVLFFVALLISIVELCLLARRGKKVKQSLDTLQSMHSKQMLLAKRQKELSEKLKNANSRLSNRVAVYGEDFINVYHLVSTYITYEKNVRTQLSNLLKTNNVRKAIRILDSNSDIDGQLRLFYGHFDHAFLAMYPDFIGRINNLLKPECRFDGNITELTTSLRIYALVVLGVTDSIGIADFLHLSSQTVYNYRLRMRRSALGDEKKFDDDVINLFAQK